MFYRCESLTNVNLNFDTSKVTLMNNMFYDCGELTNLNLSSFNLEKLEDSSYMFYRCLN